MYSEKPTSLYYRWCPSSVQTDPRFKRLNLKQHGFYRLILDAMWQHDMARIEDSYEACRFWLPVDRRDWKEITDHLVSVGLLQRDAGFLRSPELEREAETAYLKSKHASKSARSKWAKHAKSLEQGDADAMRTQCERNAPILSNPILSTNPPIPPKPKSDPAEQFKLPDWVPAEPWLGYVEMRKKSKRPMTYRAMKLAVAELSKLRERGNDPGAVLDQSTLRNWQGLFDVKPGAATQPPADGAVTPAPGEGDPDLWEREAKKRGIIN